MTKHFRRLMALGFCLLFFALAAALGVISVQFFAESFYTHKNLAEGLLKALNMAVISLATFELGLGVQKEYTDSDEDHDILLVLRRTVSRFVSIVCIALVLEGLIMVIKYSQLELAGNLPYPVAIIASAAALLVALGAFLHLSRGPLRGPEVDGTKPQPDRVLLTEPWQERVAPRVVHGSQHG